MVEVLKQASDHRKKTGKKNTEMMNFLTLTSYILASLKTLVLPSAIYWLFSKSQFSGGSYKLIT